MKLEMMSKKEGNLLTKITSFDLQALFNFDFSTGFS